MRLADVRQFVNGTSSPAFAVNGTSEIVAWNEAATVALGIAAEDAVGRTCCKVIRGQDESGSVCSTECIVRRRAHAGQTVADFDLKIRIGKSYRWFGVTPVVVNVEMFDAPFLIHLLRSNDVRKRLELTMRNFIVSETDLDERSAAAVKASSRSVSKDVDLTRRESQVLKLCARGLTSKAIAGKLGISETTVNNHVQRILRKLNCHSRLEAIHRAERSGLV